MLISFVTLVTGILAALGELLGVQRDLQADDEQDETIQQFASDLHDMEARLDEHHDLLEALEEEEKAF